MFLKEISQGTLHGNENAFNLYQGRYFESNPVSEWLTHEEQYYHQQFVLVADHLLNAYIEAGEFQRALDITHKILNDDPYWEAGYRAQMLIFHQLGQISMVHEVYHRCVEILKEQLNASISPKTEAIYRKLVSEP